MSHVILWTYAVRAERTGEFERLYGPEGGWARLMAGHAGYRGTELLRDRADPRRYVTIDRWDSVGDYERFRERTGAEFAALDAQGEALTVEETRIGAFEIP